MGGRRPRSIDRMIFEREQFHFIEHMVDRMLDRRT